MKLAYGEVAEEGVGDRFHPRGFVQSAVNENLPDIGKPRRAGRVYLKLPRALDRKSVV